MITAEQQKRIDEFKKQKGIVSTSSARTSFDLIDSMRNASTQQESSRAKEILGGAKAAVGGFASGVGGPILTAQEYAAKKLVNKFGSEEMKKRAENLDLHGQFKKDFAGEEHPNIYGASRLGGEIAGLAAPVTKVGKGVELGVKGLGAGQKTATIAKAGAEGLAFTAGMGLAEGEKQSLGDYAINAGLNIAFPVGGYAIKGATEQLPSRIINSLIKPLKKDFAYGKDPGRTISELGITANSFDDLITKIQSTTDSVGSKIGELLNKSGVQPISNLDDILKPIDDAIENASYTPRTNKALLNRLDEVKADLIQVMSGKGTVMDAQNLKRVVGDMTKWTGNATDDKAVNKALRQSYGKIVGIMDDAMQKTLTPEEFAQYKKLTGQYGDLLSAKNATIYRDQLLERQNMISFGAKNAGILTALGTAVATGGAAIPTMIAGLTGVAVDKALASPAFKTRLAALLSRMRPEHITTFFEKVPTAKALFKTNELDDLLNKAKTKVDNAVQKFNETPNKQGGFVKLPGGEMSKLEIHPDDIILFRRVADNIKTGKRISPSVMKNLEDTMDAYKISIPSNKKSLGSHLQNILNAQEKVQQIKFNKSIGNADF